ncbi:MAG: hypothetical protein FGF48_02460 [Candidatus Brockarchaeota archaeon]|nr:hypothetical protein [Candidatus Brockarchaeota archaeon]
MQPRRKTGFTLVSMLVLILVSSLLLSVKTSGQFFELSDLYVYVKANMNEEAITVFNVNLTMGPKTIRALGEANWTFKIQLPKWAAPNLVSSIDMPKLFLENGEKIALRLEEDEDYDYLVAEIPPFQGERLNATVRFGLVQRDDVAEDYVGFKLPVLTGFSIMPEYVNFTFLTTGAIKGYSLQYFNPIFLNDTVIGLWNQYFRTRTVGNVTGRVVFSKSFDRCVIKSLAREITVTEQLQVNVKDVLRLKYVGNSYRSEILKINVPANVNQSVKVKDALGMLQTSTSASTASNTSVITVYSRYSLRPGQEYEAVVEYSVPVKNMLVSSSGGSTIIRLTGLPNYTDIVETFSLKVRVEGKKSWRIEAESTVASIEEGGVFSLTMRNAMPDILAQPFQISFSLAQLEAGKSISMLLGLLALLILMVAEIFREEAKPVEAKRGREVERLVNDLVEALREKIDCETLLEEVRVKNAVGKISSREYKERVGEYERRASRAEKKILKTIEEVSRINGRVGEEVERRYRVFEEINGDSKNMINSTIERFRGGRITRSVFENLAGKYLKENRKRRETAASDVYSALEKLIS